MLSDHTLSSALWWQANETDYAQPLVPDSRYRETRRIMNSAYT